MTERKTANKLVAYIMALMMVLAFMPLTAQGVYAADGDQDEVIVEIGNAEDLVGVAETINSGGPAADGYLLTDDIDLGTINVENFVWPGIGTEDYPFVGTFNGQGHIVSGLNGAQGLFGHVKNASIYGVIVAGTVTAGQDNDVAGVVGCVCAPDPAEGRTVIVGVGNYAEITGEGENVAGVVGHVETGAKVMVAGAFNKGTVVGYDYVGGIVGRNQSAELDIITSYNDGAVTATNSNITRGDAYAAGICADECAFDDVYNTGKVTGWHYSNSSRKVVERGYAIKAGTSNEDLGDYYWLKGTAYRAYRSSFRPLSDDSVDMETLVKGVLAFNEDSEPWPWIEGKYVNPVGAVTLAYDEEPTGQENPGLVFETDFGSQKEIAINALDNYVNPEDYGDAQKAALETAILVGKEAINSAEDFQSLGDIYLSAIDAVEDVPNKKFIEKEQAELDDEVDPELYNIPQWIEVEKIIDKAKKEFETALTKDELYKLYYNALDEIAKYPTSAEVEKADLAKVSLSELVITANSIIGAAEYTKASMAVLKDAIAAAKDVYYDDNAFEKDVVKAYEAVWDALFNLTEGSDTDKSQLLKTMIAAQKVDKKVYTKSSYNALQKTISAANKLLANPDATAEDFREANVTVLEAHKDLVKKSANTMKVKTTKKTVKYKKVKKAKKVVKAITVKKAVGKVTYAKKSGSKYLSVNKKTGKVTVKKGTKKGKYTMKVAVKAAGNDNVKAATKNVSVVIIVK